MSDGAKTGTEDEIPLDGGNRFKTARELYLQTKLDVTRDDLTEALKVAGEALDKAERAIYDLAYTGTVRIRDLGGECDDAATTGDIAFKKSGIEESRAALERIRNNNQTSL